MVLTFYQVRPPLTTFSQSATRAARADGAARIAGAALVAGAAGGECAA